jgi:hypothetical protein
MTNRALRELRITVAIETVIIILSILAAATWCHGQTVKPALPSTAPGCCPACNLPNVPKCKPSYVFGGGGMTNTTNSVMDSFQLNDTKGPLVICKTHDLDTNTFTGCRLIEGRTLDEVLNVTFKELQRPYDKERKP